MVENFQRTISYNPTLLVKDITDFCSAVHPMASITIFTVVMAVIGSYAEDSLPSSITIASNLIMACFVV